MQRFGTQSENVSLCLDCRWKESEYETNDFNEIKEVSDENKTFNFISNRIFHTRRL
jgi:hypothetical protein